MLKASTQLLVARKRKRKEPVPSSKYCRQSPLNGNSSTGRSEKSHLNCPWFSLPTKKSNVKGEGTSPPLNFILKQPFSGAAGSACSAALIALFFLIWLLLLPCQPAPGTKCS